MKLQWVNTWIFALLPLIICNLRQGTIFKELSKISSLWNNYSQIVHWVFAEVVIIVVVTGIIAMVTSEDRKDVNHVSIFLWRCNIGCQMLLNSTCEGKQLYRLLSFLLTIFDLFELSFDLIAWMPLLYLSICSFNNLL